MAKRLVLLAALAGLVSCGGDNLLLPRDVQPARISIVKGDKQTGTVGQSLADSLVVLVTDPGLRPVEGVKVVFIPPAGADVAPGDTIMTGPTGQAAVHYTLSTTAGEQTIQARAIPITPPSASTATFTASAQPEGASALVGVGGDGQTGQVATVLAESLAVRAVDRFGNGVPGVEVKWEGSGGGQVSPASVATGSDGRAATARTLGERPGSYRATASAEGLAGSPVSFTNTAVAAPRPGLVLITEPSAIASAGVPLEQQPELQLQDQLGAPLNQPDVGVTVQIASGSGSLGGSTSARSDANGRVRFTDLEMRGETGSRTLIFAAEGFTPVTSGVITVKAGPPASDRSSISVPNGTAGVATTIALHLEDQFGNLIVTAGNVISISVAGANPSPGLPVTEVGGGSYSTSYVPIHSGADAVTIQFNGAPLAGSPFQSAVTAGPAAASHTTADVTRTAGFITTITAVVTVRDAEDNALGHGGNQVQVQLNGSGPLNAIDNGDGTYSASILTFGSEFTVAITLDGVPIRDSPFTPRVQ